MSILPQQKIYEYMPYLLDQLKLDLDQIDHDPKLILGNTNIYIGNVSVHLRVELSLHITHGTHIYWKEDEDK